MWRVVPDVVAKRVIGCVFRLPHVVRTGTAIVATPINARFLNERGRVTVSASALVRNVSLRINSEICATAQSLTFVSIDTDMGDWIATVKDIM